MNVVGVLYLGSGPDQMQNALAMRLLFFQVFDRSSPPAVAQFTPKCAFQLASAILHITSPMRENDLAWPPRDHGLHCVAQQFLFVESHPQKCRHPPVAVIRTADPDKWAHPNR